MDWKDRLDSFFSKFGMPAYIDEEKGTMRAMITFCEIDFNEEEK